jgi:N-methylhydantoinase A
MTLRLGCDTGGTFTDLVAFDEQSGHFSFHKVSSTPADPGQAIVQGWCELVERCRAPQDAVRLLVHGTTIATNAVLQREGAKIGVITTSGFRDVLHIQRQDRPRMYDLRSRRAKPLAPRHLRLELNERTLFDGSVRTPVDHSQLTGLIHQLRSECVDAVAVCFLHSYINPANELEVGRVLAKELPKVTVSLSHEVIGELGEYERFSTCAMNAYVQPVMHGYLSRLDVRLNEAGFVSPLFVMKSNGGVMSSDAAGRQSVETILSGPSGGVVAGIAMAKLHHNQNLITADMGGTSFDVSVIHEGRTVFARESEMGGLALAVPMLDIHTVGAGGGSIAWVDSGGSLRVGPHSAGAVPGPACYGRGGPDPTVTDANLVLGRLSPASLLGGGMALDLEAARRAIHDCVALPLGLPITTAAEGITRVVNATMTAAIRKLTVERGLDPSDFVLCPFGGAGPLHGAELASEMGIQECLVPIAPGITSAIGLLMSNLREDRVRTHIAFLGTETLPEIGRILDELSADASARLGFADSARSQRRAFGMRYHGQRYELLISVTDGKLDQLQIKADFHREHQRVYGYDRRDQLVEVASIWVSVELDLQAVAFPQVCRATTDPTPSASRQVFYSAAALETPIYSRVSLGAGATLVGPAIIEQLDATTVVWPGQRLRVDDYGQMVMGPIQH